jgi:hypothetical protein
MLTTGTIIAGMGIVAIAIAAVVARLADGTAPTGRERSPRPDRAKTESGSAPPSP